MVSACLPALPSDYARAPACPCLAFGFACEAHRAGVRRKTYHPILFLRRLQLPIQPSPPTHPCCHCRCHRWVVAVIITIAALLCSPSRVLFASHTLVSARRHSPTPHPPAPTHQRPPTRGAPASLYFLPWTTDKQADGRTHSQTDTKSEIQKARKQQKQQVSNSVG